MRGCFLKSLAILVVSLIAFLLVGTLVINLSGARAWKAFKEAKGAELEWSHWIPAPIPDEENAAAVAPLRDRHLLDLDIHETWTGHPSTPGWQAGVPHDLTALFEDRSARRRPSPEPGPDASAAKAPPPSPATDPALAHAALEAYFNEHQDVFQALHEAARRPQCRLDLNYERGMLMDFQGLRPWRTSIRALALRGLYHLQNGNPDAAFEDCLANLHLIRHARAFPLLIGHLAETTLVGVNHQLLWEGLRIRAWGEAQLIELEMALSSLDLPADFLVAMKEERAAFVDIIDRMAENRKGYTEELGFDLGSPGARTIYRRIPKGWLYRNAITYCEFLDDAVFDPQGVAVEVPDPLAMEEAFDRILAHRRESRFSALHPHRILAYVALPWFQHAYMRTLQMQTAIDQARLAVALERHWLKEGRYPDSLDALAPEFLMNIPVDRVTKEPLHYRIKEDGTIQNYSVGMNREDDGGVPLENLEEGDWVWQYTHPDFDEEAFQSNF